MARASRDVAVVGGGVIGLAIAFELSRRGAGRICVLDHGNLGGEASRAAAGLLTVDGQRAPGGSLLEMCRRSAASYEVFLEALSEEGGARLWVDRCGLLVCAGDPAERVRCAAHVAHRQGEGARADLLERGDLDRLAPGLSPVIMSGAFYADDGRIDPPALMAALRNALKTRGVEVRQAPVKDLDCDADRVVGLRTAEEDIAVAAVVVAAGCWSGPLTSVLGATLPIRAARGEMIAVRSAPPRCVVARDDTSVIPRAPDVAWIGATREHGDDPAPTPRGLDLLRRRAADLFPDLAAAPVIGHWAGIRPRSILLRPIVDRVPGTANAFVATGHHRQGFLLAPLTAQVVASLVLGESPPVPLEPWSWRRRRGRPYARAKTG